ncbi:hypothetical protein ACIQU4_14305 [Streptomyces sp. NPDC090741]|uniref:hypothetical protein n=1 Tax=Streptomyces sp. NPDC090741 TaxID=3365967 RepID=UPI0037F42C13
MTGAVHLIEHRAAWAFAVLALAPVGIWWWAQLRRRPTSRHAALWRAEFAAFATACAAWLAAAVWFAPTHRVLSAAWAVLTLVSQISWLAARRLTSGTEKESS